LGPNTALTRFVRRVRHSENGEVHWFKESRHRGELVRVGVLFAATILIPSILLAYFALASSRSEELSLDLELRERSEAIATQLHRDLSASYYQFEQATLERLTRGQSPLNHLTELTPYLKVGFRFDQTGLLVAPFEMDSPVYSEQPSTAFRAGHTYAQQLERDKQYEQAALHYRAAGALTQTPKYFREAQLGEARSLWEAGGKAEATTLLIRLADEKQTRDRFGFRFRDLAILKMAEFRLQDDPESSTNVLRDLIEQLLTERWTIGRPGEATIARRALSRLEGKTDPDWLARARTRLGERSVQFQWATQIRDELELFAGAQIREQDGVFQYYARPESEALWSSVQAQGNLYTFAFSARALLEDLNSAAVRASTVDADLQVTLEASDSATRKNTLYRRSLSPWIPYVSVLVQPVDPEALAAQKSQRRQIRLMIIGLSILMVVVGIISTAQLVTREIETAWEKTDFAANVSHELRSPITQIRLKAEALQYDLVNDDADRRGHYDAIVREAERLSRLVDNVLDFAAIERGAKTYSLRPAAIDDILFSSVEACAAVMEQSKCEIELNIEPHLPTVWIDRDAISQVFINLISNAAKYGSSGEWVGVKAHLIDDQIEVAVMDKGMGIKKEDLKHVFEHFYRSTDPRVRKKKGTGIGLAIVKYIMETHGGEVTVESTLGKGTTFTVHFPLNPPESLGA
jgi:signal transduction histidine kinase